jgi:O-antigen/teichoic acid export membrane protein
VTDLAGGHDAVTRTTGRSVLGGGMWYLLAQAAPQLYTLAVSIAAARFLGVEGLGRQSFISFVALSVAMLVGGGFPLAVGRYVGETMGRAHPARVRGLIRWAWTVQALLAIVGGAILAATALAGAEPESAWLLAAVATVVAMLHNVPSAALIGLQRWRAASIVGLVTGAVSVAATIAVLAAGGGITGMFAVEAAISTVNLVWTTVLARRALEDASSSVEAPGPLRREVVRFAAITSVSVVLTFVVWRRSELFFLERYSTDAEIALYSIPFAMVTALGMLPLALAGVLATALATLFGGGAMNRIRSGFGRALRLIVLVSLPLTAAGLALGPLLLRLVYGEEYEEAGRVLRILLLAFPLVAATHASGALLAGLGRIVVPLILGAIAAALNLGLDAALIPGRGAEAAAVANVCAQAAGSAMVTAYALYAIGGIGLEPRRLVAATVASAGGGAVAWAVGAELDGWAGLLLGLAAGLVVFAALGRLGRLLSYEDARWLEATVTERLQRPVAALCRLWAVRDPA